MRSSFSFTISAGYSSPATTMVCLREQRVFRNEVYYLVKLLLCPAVVLHESVILNVFL